MTAMCLYKALIPLAYCDLLPNGIWDALIEINNFFRDICSSKLQTYHIERLEMNIVETICKLEMILPPSFFDSMKHLPDTTKRLMSSPKCKSVKVINNPARPGSNHKEVNCINYK